MILSKHLPQTSQEYLEHLKPIFSKRLKELREDRGYSQSHLSQILHVSRSCITSWENSISLPDIQNLVAICETLNISIDYMLGITDKQLEFTDEREIVEFSTTKYLNISKLNPDQIFKLVDYYHSLIK